nr:unnamed protein product [Callosobruchus analis]
MNQTRPMHNQPMSQFFYQPSNMTFQTRFNSSFPTGPVNLPRPVQRPQRLFTNSQVFRQPQANKNVFKPNPSRTLPQPTPMSTSNRHSFNPQHNSTSYQQSKPNWVPEELFNTDTENDDNYKLVEQNQNFLRDSSPDRQS